MGALVTSLQPNTRVLGNSALLKLNLVLAIDSPLLTGLVTTRHHRSNLGHQLLVVVSSVTTSNHDQIDIETFIRRGLAASELGSVVSDVQADTVVGQLGDVLDFAVVEQALGPVRFIVAVNETLSVEAVVHVLQQLETNDTVVSCLVHLDGLSTDGRILVEGVVCALGVEDLVDEGGVV